MKISGMEHFQNVCKHRLLEWYQKNKPDVKVDLYGMYIVWSCKTLQNYKCLASTSVNGDGIYAEYTFNGDKGELYEDVYEKTSNTCYTEE